MASRAVLFPGQGAQFSGMSADLLERAPGCEEMFAAASRAMGVDLLRLCKEGPDETLNSTAVSQPAIFVVSLAVVRAIEAAGGRERLDAAATAGLSLGEYTALVFAGALPFEAALEIVVRRGAYMQEACDRMPGGMVSLLGLDLATVEEVVEEASRHGIVAVANVNAATQVVISGEIGALERASELARARGARRAIPLKVAGAYHSALMAPASAKLRPFLERAPIVRPRIPFYPNVSARPAGDPGEIRDGLLRQIEAPVLWAPTLDALLASEIDCVLEPGPGRVIAGLVRQLGRDLPVASVLDGATIDRYLGKGS